MPLRKFASRCALSVLVFAYATSTVSCSEESKPEEDTGDTKDSLKVTLPTFDIEPGESFQCYYSDIITDKELSVITAVGGQVDGGHHLSVYYVDSHRDPGMEECTSAEMLDWHFVVGAGGEGNSAAQLQLPKGLAFKIPEGKQLMVQAHYINVSGEKMVAKDWIELGLVGSEEVEDYAADFVIDEDRFEIEPHAEYTSTITCEVPQDLRLTLLLGHMHEQGAHFSLEKVDADGKVLESMYDEAWAPQYASHPPMLTYTKEEPLFLEKGTLLRQTCSWKNETDKRLLFPTEMCIGFGYYFPGTERVMCERVETEETP